MITNILKIKDITAIEKLILIDIAETPSIFPYKKTSADIAAATGTKQKEIKIALNTLEEKGIIETRVGYRTRTTKFSNQFLNSIK
jgi:DNA-binding MarR family transcriptional regulator